MEIIFTINYHTTWGQNIYICGTGEQLGNRDISRCVPMQYAGNGEWRLTIVIPDNISTFEYQYIVKDYDTILKTEWGNMRKFIRTSSVSSCLIIDKWRDAPDDSVFYASFFYRNIFAHEKSVPQISYDAETVTFRVYAPQIKPDEVIAVTGNSGSIGNWNPEKAIVLDGSTSPLWQAPAELDKTAFPLEYKYIILKKNTRQLIAWEVGENRIIQHFPLQQKQSLVLPCDTIRHAEPVWKGAGLVIPVFSLKSRESWGIGEFPDLRLMADWAVKTGQHIVQILPVNDTTLTHTWLDSYPYNAVSVFALNPIYLHPEGIGKLKNTERMAYYTDAKHRINQLPEIDFKQVSALKWEYFREIYREIGRKTLESDTFNRFFEQNKYWLQPYALFCYLRDLHKTSDFNQWAEWKTFQPEKAEKTWAISSTHYHDIAFYYFLQFHADKQLSEACNYTRSQGISIKGDIPIGICRHSVDAWVSPHLFHLNSQAGAPPDDFSVTGQNWGFPTYNWEEMAKDGYAWWKMRFKKMADYFDAYRIDHILGFFRIWEIPMESIEGLLGHFNPALPYSPEEMQYYDFFFDKQKHAEPYLTPSHIEQLFGDDFHEITKKYLEMTPSGRYSLKPEVNTQRKIEAAFAGLTEQQNISKKEKLYSLPREVLFVQDPDKPGLYHPRISAQQTQAYQALNIYERASFDRLYNDFFYFRHNEFWEQEALKKLPPLISATDMLTCGEDLGMIPACVPHVMDKLKILSLEIQRMPKELGRLFADTYTYPYLSVCSTSTHDMPTLREWWEENRDYTQKYFSEILHQAGDTPVHAETWICEKILNLHLQSPSILAIIPLQDWLSIDSSVRKEDPRSERINVPSNPRHYWRYRMHLYIEDLLNNQLLNERIKQMVLASGR